MVGNRGRPDVILNVAACDVGVVLSGDQHCSFNPEGLNLRDMGQRLGHGPFARLGDLAGLFFGYAVHPLDDLIRQLSAANESAIATTGKIDPEDLATLGHRGEDNPITVEGVIHYLASHMELHARQITTSRQLINRAGS